LVSLSVAEPGNDGVSGGKSVFPAPLFGNKPKALSQYKLFKGLFHVYCLPRTKAAIPGELHNNVAIVLLEGLIRSFNMGVLIQSQKPAAKFT
jgi:hypothetical protein